MITKQKLNPLFYGGFTVIPPQKRLYISSDSNY